MKPSPWRAHHHEPADSLDDDEDRPPAVTQDEANVIVTAFDLRRYDHIHVHWLRSRHGLLPVLHPIRNRPETWEYEDTWVN